MGTLNGYVYVMINSSYGEGVVKIGKTTKSPEERAKELSSATGVATPFVVVYKKEFQNCHAAERMIHEILEDKGCRVNSNREFFALEITEAINLIMQTPSDVGAFEDMYEEPSIDLEVEEEADNNEDLAEEFYQLATEYANGSEDTFQDYDKALIYYERSASFGKAKALHDIGMIYRYVKHNSDKALQYFHNATKAGYWQSFRDIASIYADKNARCYNQTNSDLAWRKFFENLDVHNDELDVWEWNIEGIGDDCMMYLFGMLTENKEIPTFIDHLFYKNREHLKYAFEKKLQYFEENDYEILVDPFKRKVGKYIEELEEKLLLNDSVGDALAENYFTVAEKYFYGRDGYEKNTYKALRYYKESAKRGYYRAYIEVGRYWLTESERDDHVDSAWKEFYNAIYDKVEDGSYELTNAEKNTIIDGFYEMIDLAMTNDKRHLLHDYYFMMALHVGITDYMETKTAELTKIAEEISADPYDDNLDYTNASTEEMLANTDKLIKSINYRTDFEKLTRTSTVLKEYVNDLKARATGEEFKMYRL